MAALTHLDTHVVIWAVAGEHQRLTALAARALEEGALRISPMVNLELTYLHEIGRITAPAADVLERARPALGLAPADEDFGAVIETAQALDWTSDPFDRIISAQALVAKARLVTMDSTIREHLGIAVW